MVGTMEQGSNDMGLRVHPSEETHMPISRAYYGAQGALDQVTQHMHQDVASYDMLVLNVFEHGTVVAAVLMPRWPYHTLLMADTNALHMWTRLPELCGASTWGGEHHEHRGSKALW